MNSTKPPPGCVVLVLTAAFLWLGGIVLMGIAAYRQEQVNAQKEASLSAHVRSVTGAVDSVLMVPGPGNEPSTPQGFVITYRYAAPNSPMLTGRAMVSADKLTQMGILKHKGTMSYWNNPGHWTVEYNARDPSISRLQGVPFEGGASPQFLQNEIILAGIGVTGFLILASIVIGPWLQHRPDRRPTGRV